MVEYSHTYNDIGEYEISINSTKNSAKAQNLEFGNTTHSASGMSKVKEVWLGTKMPNIPTCSKSLKAIMLGNTITQTNNKLKSTGLKAVICPTTVTTVSEGAFSYCDELKIVSLPKAVTTIGFVAFTECLRLEKINLPPNLTNLGGLTGNHGNTFQLCYYLLSAEIPSGVTIIDQSLFYNCIQLKSVTIKGDITEMRSQVFSGCNRLQRVYLTSCTAVPTLTSSNCFTNTPTSLKIIVPDALYDNWVVANNWSDVASKIVRESEA